MYAIEYRRSGKYLRATDKRFYPPKQILGFRGILMYENINDAKHQFRSRKCDPNDFEIVELEYLIRRRIAYDPI